MCDSAPIRLVGPPVEEVEEAGEVVYPRVDQAGEVAQPQVEQAREVVHPPVEEANAASAGRPHARNGRGLLSAAISTAGAWLIDPAEGPEHALETAAHTLTSPRAVIAVFGLARGCGATVVARALAAELAGRDASGTAAVACDVRASGIPLATHAASRLAEALEDVPGATTRAVGRLCLVEGADHDALADTSRYLAPLILDAGSASIGGVTASIADRTVLVSSPTVEPALGRVAAACLERVGVECVVVLNRAWPHGETGDGHELEGGEPAIHAEAGIIPLPDSRLGAQLALGGREPRGQLGRAISALADWCEGIR
jgi:hypothetical protein